MIKKGFILVRSIGKKEYRRKRKKVINKMNSNTITLKRL